MSLYIFHFLQVTNEYNQKPYSISHTGSEIFPNVASYDDFRSGKPPSPLTSQKKLKSGLDSIASTIEDVLVGDAKAIKTYNFLCWKIDFPAILLIISTLSSLIIGGYIYVHNDGNWGTNLGCMANRPWNSILRPIFYFVTLFFTAWAILYLYKYKVKVINRIFIIFDYYYKLLFTYKG